MKTPTLGLTSLILFLSMISAIAIDIYLPALPTIAKEFSVSADIVQQSLTTYFIGFCIGMLIFGPLSDYLGHKKLILFGLTIFTASSLMCVLVDDISSFLWLRFFQSIGGGAVFVISRALAGHLWPEQEVGKIMSLIMGVGWIGPIIAPAVGAEILRFESWQSIFIVLFAMGACSLAVSIKVIPNSTKIANDNSSNVFNQAFESYKSILKDTQSRNLILCSSLIAAAYFAYLSGSSFILTEFYKLSIREYSAVFAISAFGMLISSFVNRSLLNKMSEAKILTVTSYISVVMTSVLAASYYLNVSAFIFNILVFLCLFSHIPIQANCATILVNRSQNMIGASIALLLSFTFGLGAVSSYFVSLATAKIGSPEPITATLIMALCTGMALIYMVKAKV